MVTAKFSEYIFNSVHIFKSCVVPWRGDKYFVLLTQYRAGDKIKKNEMGWACGAYGWREGGV